MKNLKRCMYLPLLMACIPVWGQALKLQWANSLTGSWGLSSPRILADPQKNVYVTGYFSGTVDFDPGNGKAMLTADSTAGKGSGFLAKYDAEGKYVFAYALPGMSMEEITQDPQGHIVLAGYFSTSIDPDPGAGTATLTSAGSFDVFVAMYEPDGSFTRAFGIGGKGSDEVQGMALDSAGNIYVAGSFRDTIDLDPGAGAYKLYSQNENTFLAKYSNSGTMLYAICMRNIGSGTNDAFTLAVEASGRATIGGRFQGTADFNPGPSVASSVSNGVDGYVARFDASGNYLSHFNYDGIAYAIDLDASGNTYITGTMPDSMDMDPGPGKKFLHSYKIFDMYLVKLDAAGNLAEAKGFFSNKTYVPERIKCDRNGHLCIIGRMTDTVYFDPQDPNGLLLPKGGNDAFMVRFDEDLELVSAFCAGNTGSDLMLGLDMDALGRTWIAGSFNGSIDIDPGPDSSLHNSPLKAGLFFGCYKDSGAQSGILTAKPDRAGIYSSGDVVYITFPASQDSRANVRIYSLSGELVWESSNNVAGSLRIKLTGAAPGIYVVQVSNGSIYSSGKVFLE